MIVRSYLRKNPILVEVKKVLTSWMIRKIKTKIRNQVLIQLQVTQMHSLDNFEVVLSANLIIVRVHLDTVHLQTHAKKKVALSSATNPVRRSERLCQIKTLHEKLVFTHKRISNLRPLPTPTTDEKTVNEDRKSTSVVADLWKIPDDQELATLNENGSWRKSGKSI